MRLSYLCLATAVLVATPVSAQNNATANEANATSANEVTANAAAPINAITSAPAAPTTPGGETTTLPTNTTRNEAGSVVVQKDKTFPWGVLGLVGLIGLLGRRRSTS